MAKSRPPRRVSLHPFLTLLLIPALVSAAVSASDPLAAVAESPSLPRELRARLRASSVELASAGLAPLVDAAVDARGGAEAIARRLRETRHAVEALCGSALELEDPVEDPHLLATAPPADVPPDPTPVVDTPSELRGHRRDRRKPRRALLVARRRTRGAPRRRAHVPVLAALRRRTRGWEETRIQGHLPHPGPRGRTSRVALSPRAMELRPR